MTNSEAAQPIAGALRAAVVFTLLPLIFPLIVGAYQPVQAQQSGVQPESEANDRPVNALRAGDMIEIMSWREPDMEGEYLVDEDGRVMLPMLGSIVVTDRVPTELRRELQDEYQARFREESVQVILRRRVRILGAVEEPGLYHVDPTMTAGDVLALAGGVTEAGNPNQIRVIREGETVRELQLRSDTPFTEEVRSGDQVMVLQRSWFSRHSTLFVGALASGVVFYFTRR